MRSVNLRALALVVGFAVCGSGAYGQQTQTILFNPNGGGASGAISVSAFDWAPGNAVQLGGNPSGGVVVGTAVQLLTHGRLAVLLDQNSQIVALPAGVEFTFVAGFPEAAVSTSAGPSASFALAASPGSKNFFEIWVGIPPNADMLAGTGFNDLSGTSHRILSGFVTAATGNFGQTTSNCGGGSTTLFDQSADGIDNYSGKQTVCGTGATDLTVNIITADPDYFPGITPDVIDTTVTFMNQTTVVPFKQTNPSHLFVDDGAGFNGQSPPAPSIAPILGNVNGQPPASGVLDFQTQTDPNESFRLGTAAPGQCRVTYGGNDKNGNIDPNKFGQACSSDKGNTENCYTFGGQVGAPTADPALGGPFGEHTHHQVSGPAGDFVFRAGTHSAPSNTRITATACKDPGACRQAVANASFKQIDFEGTGSFRTLDATAVAYFNKKVPGLNVQPDNQDTRSYYFRVDMDDNGEPGDKPSKSRQDIQACGRFLAADQNYPLSTPDPLLNDYASCQACADVYQIYICKDENPCEQKDAIYAVRGFLTGGNIQMHRIVK